MDYHKFNKNTIKIGINIAFIFMIRSFSASKENVLIGVKALERFESILLFVKLQFFSSSVLGLIVV